MADEKKTQLSIVLRTVDKATAGIRAVNAKLDAISKPTRDFGKALGELREKSGLNGVIDGFKGVGSAIGDLLGKVALIGGAVGVATAGLISMVRGFDDLGKKAGQLGVGVDFLAEMRFAADHAGIGVEELDGGLQALSENLGQARSGMGRMAAFLKNGVKGPLLDQLKATKSNEEAMFLLADAFAKVTDPAKRAALAQKVFGNSKLATLAAQGSKALKDQGAHYLTLAGSQEGAAKKSAEVTDAMTDMNAAVTGIKAALVEGLSPALTVIVKQLTEWFSAHRADVAQWAEDIGKKLPDAIQEVVKWLGKAWDKVTAFVDAIGGIKNAAILAGAVLAGPLISSVVGLAGALVGALSKAGALAKAMREMPSSPVMNGAGTAMGAVGAIAAPIAAAFAVNAATGGDLIDHAQSQGYKSDNIVDLFNEVGQRQQDPNAPSSADIAAQVASNLQSIRNQGETKITVDFANAPRGTRATTDPQSTAAVDLNMGYNMLPGLGG